MLYYVLASLVVALLAGALGFTGIAAGAIEIARVLFLLFLVIVALSFLLAAFSRRPMD